MANRGSATQKFQQAHRRQNRMPYLYLLRVILILPTSLQWMNYHCIDRQLIMTTLTYLTAFKSGAIGFLHEDSVAEFMRVTLNISSIAC